MELTKQYDDAERRFLKNQAQELRNNNQPCELHTRTQGSLYRGRVLEADEGGIVFQQEDGRRVAVPISLVEKFVGIPISSSEKTADLAHSAAAGSGTVYQWGHSSAHKARGCSPASLFAARLCG